MELPAVAVGLHSIQEKYTPISSALDPKFRDPQPSNPNRDGKNCEPESSQFSKNNEQNMKLKKYVVNQSSRDRLRSTTSPTYARNRESIRLRISEEPDF